MGRKASGKLCSDTTKCRQKNGWTYLFSREREYNPETKRYRTVRKTLVGKYPPGDPCTGPPMPTRPKRKSASTVSEHSQEVAEEGNKSKLTISVETTAMIDIIMHVAENSGVKKEVNDLLPGDSQGVAQKLITAALYLFATDGESWPGMHGWTRKYLGALPYTSGPVSEDMLHDLFVEIGERRSLRENVFVARAKALNDEEMLALDSSTYVMETETGEILIVRNTMHKDGVIRPLLKIVFVYAIRSRRPIAYALIPANTPDSRTVHNVLKQLAMLELKELELIADGGYSTEDDIGTYLSQGQHFITHVESDIKWVSPLIEQYRDTVLYEGEIMETDSKFYGVKTTVTRTFAYQNPETQEEQTVTSKVNVFIYFSHYRAGKEQEYMCSTYNFYKGLLMDGAELGQDKTKVENFAKKYMLIERNEKGKIVQITRNDKSWKKAVKLHGFIVLLADQEANVNSAFEKYRLREKIEEMIKSHKAHVGGRIISKHKTETIEGQAFVEFEALTMRGSFEIELKNLKGKLAVPTGNSEHDTSAVYQQERRVRNWLNKTSLVNVLKWFDAIKKVSGKFDESAFKWVSEYLERDKIVLRYLGVMKGPEQTELP